MAEQHQLTGRDREAGLKALNTLHRLLQKSPELAAAKVRDEVNALVGLLDADVVDELVINGSSDEQKIKKILDGRSYEGRSIRKLAEEMGSNIRLFTELYYDLCDSEDHAKGIKRGGFNRIEESDLEGKDLTEDLLRIELDRNNLSQSKFSDWVRENVISKGIDQAFVKIDWDKFKDSSDKDRIPWLLERRIQFPIQGIRITPVIVCTASDLFHEILQMPDASGMLASGVKWIRKRNT